jgi:hypothetical protein
LKQKGITVSQIEFAKWNALPLLVMTSDVPGLASGPRALASRPP